MAYKRFGYVVDSCPISQEETTEAAVRLNCSVDENGRSQYVCVPNQDLTSIVEFCYTKSIVGLYEDGYCLKTVNDGFLDQISCKSFTEGCPTEFFRSTDLFKYPSCHRLNTEDRCFVADPSCNASTVVGKTSTSVLGFPNTTVDYTSNASAIAVDDDSAHLGAIVGVVVPLLILLVILIVAFLYRKCPQGLKGYEQNLGYRKDKDMELTGSTKERQSLLSEDSLYETESRMMLESTTMTETFFHQASGEKIGDYSVWKTLISGQFSRLTDDEVSVLFCFPCSDSGPPDFTDTEWLDTLNEIRWNVYRKKDPVTSEEAQQILDRLKSRDFLWVDQTSEHLTEDAQDEIMYRVSNRVDHIYIVFYLSSFITAQRYLRSWGYNRKPGEKCITGYIVYSDSLLIRRLQMDVLTHVTMEETEIFDEVSQILNIPRNIVEGSEEEQEEFLEKLKKTGEGVNYRGRSQDSMQQVKWHWRYGDKARPDIVRSCIGLHPHNDIYIIGNKAYRKPSRYHCYSPDLRNLLYCLLLVDEYTLDVNEHSHKFVLKEVKERYFTDLTSSEEPNVKDMPEGIIDKQECSMTFKSEEIRHDVMYAFVTECLVGDCDLKFFLTTASRRVVSDYCRSWNYKRSEGERCLYIPEEMYDLLIDSLQEDILTHSFVSEKEYHKRIKKRLNIPEEIFSWDRSALERFAKISRLGRVEMFRARGMIVGCAGAGKTTLLRKLQRKGNNENESTETTVGLEVHEELFEMDDDTLKDFSSRKDEKLIRGIQYHSSHGRKLINYFHFWLQSIKTYCDEGTTQEKDSDVEAKGISHPVILIASHKDKQSCWRKKTPFYTQLEKCLSEMQALKELISLRRYFEVECPPRTPTNEQEEKLDEVRKCIVETVKQLPQWGEQIPLKWAKLEEVFRLKKQQGEKVIDRQELKNDKNIDLSNDEDLDDSLRFFHEIGQIIYFSEEKMKNVIIINVQWFVDAFKYIITDETHLARKDCNDTLIKTGRITEKIMEEIWRNTEEDAGSGESYIRHKDKILPYLDKLGLMTKVQTKDKDTNDEMYYIPSMNRNDLSKDYENAIRRGQKTSIMVFHFKTYLPHFFFFRLVANCLNEWTALDLEMFCKNAAFYKVEDASHYIAIAVNKTSIQLQVFTPDEGMDLQTECVIKIRETVENLINEITETFHRKTKYEKGYTCTDINITEEDEKFFLTEKEVVALKTSSGKRPCPKHVVGKKIHTIDKNKILRFWRN